MSYTALYRKFRPLNFNEVVGQEHITKTLKNQIMSGRVGHAYLFNGGRGTGKTSTAKILSRAINCLKPKDGEPCNECEMCKAALEGTLTDIVEMDAASNNSVEDIRSIRDEVNFLPTSAKYRVYIIDEVHMLSIGAFNALLKTLEEPPEHVKFILATTEPQKLPATILSRCQRYDFKKISSEVIKKRLEYIVKEDNINIEDEALHTISYLAEGAMRDALSILDRCMQEQTEQITNEQVKELIGIPKTEMVYSIISEVLNSNVEGALQNVNKVLEDGKDILNLTWEIIKYVKDILVYKTTGSIDLYNEQEKGQLSNLAKLASKEKLMAIIFSLSNLSNELKLTTQKTIMFQVGIMKLCSIQENRGTAMQKEGTSSGTTVEPVVASGADYAQAQNVVNSVATSSKDIDTMKQKISNIENIVKKVVNNQVAINNSIKNMGSSEDIEKKNVTKKRYTNPNMQNIITSQSEGKTVENWGKIVSGIKETGKVMLYSNLANSKAIELNDMTIGIEFNDGLTEFEKSVVGAQENITELTRLLSIEYKKPMQIRLIDANNVESSGNELDSIAKDLDLPLNIIEQ